LPASSLAGGSINPGGAHRCSVWERLSARSLAAGGEFFGRLRKGSGAITVAQEG
jgi:hypothetical protein